MDKLCTTVYSPHKHVTFKEDFLPFDIGQDTDIWFQSNFKNCPLCKTCHPSLCWACAPKKGIISITLLLHFIKISCTRIYATPFVSLESSQYPFNNSEDKNSLHCAKVKGWNADILYSSGKITTICRIEIVWLLSNAICSYHQWRSSSELYI